MDGLVELQQVGECQRFSLQSVGFEGKNPSTELQHEPGEKILINFGKLWKQACT